MVAIEEGKALAVAREERRALDLKTSMVVREERRAPEAAMEEGRTLVVTREEGMAPLHPDLAWFREW